MSNEQFAFLKRTKVPSRAAWQVAINACGFDFQLDEELTPFEDSGFLPCKLNGADAGFEIYYDGSAELLEEFADIADGRDYCIAFRWGGNMAECASVLIASYALARYFGAVVSYEGEDPNEPEELLAEIKECIAEL